MIEQIFKLTQGNEKTVEKVIIDENMVCSITSFALDSYLHLYLIGVLVLSIHFFVRRYNQHHGTAHFILHPWNIHHVFRRLRLHNMIYYKTI